MGRGQKGKIRVRGVREGRERRQENGKDIKNLSVTKDREKGRIS